MPHVLFSVDGSLYQRWQAELLAYSHRRVGQRGTLTRLWSSDARPSSFSGSTFRAAPWSPHPITGDDYAPYNKPSAVLQWLTVTPPADQTVLLVDPDFVFVAPIEVEVSRGEPIGQPLSYLRPNALAPLVARHCRRRAALQGVGVPILIHRDDLRELAAPWLKKTEAIRDDRRSRELAGWVAEMWGYAFAAAELGLHHEARELARFSTEDRADLPLVHYCYAVTDAAGEWRWDKRTYHPWKRQGEAPCSAPRAAAAMIALLDACAEERGYRMLREGRHRRTRGC